MAATTLSSLAREVLAGNDVGHYTREHPEGVPHQRNLVSAVVSLGWAADDPARAYEELRALVAMRDNAGMVPHIAFEHGDRGYIPGPSWWGPRVSADGRRISGITELPLAATCLRLLHEQHPREDRVAEMLLALHAWHQLLLSERNHDGRFEPVLVHPWESGRASAQEWDPPLAAVEKVVELEPDGELQATERRRAMLSLVEEGRHAHWGQFLLANTGQFRVLDAGFSACLAAACVDLAALAADLGDAQTAAESEVLGYSTAAALNERAGNRLAGGYDVRADETLPGVCAGTALMLLSPSLSRSQVAKLRSLVTTGALASPYGVRTQDSGQLAWRGGASPVLTALCALGLERHGEPAAASLLRERMLTGVAGAGFYEAVHPQTGEPAGAAESSLTAAAVLWGGER